MEVQYPTLAEARVPAASLTSADLAPTSPAARTWGTWNYAALWISMSLCIPTYMLASSLIQGGMNWWQALLTIFLGNAIVLVPMILNGRAGARYGIPFSVFARASFGVLGANVPALLRAVIACGWFGIQTWIGGSACYQAAVRWWPGLGTLPAVFPASWGLATGPAITFFLFWLLNMYVVYLGVDSIRKLLVFKAFFSAGRRAGAAAVGYFGRPRARADTGAALALHHAGRVLEILLSLAHGHGWLLGHALAHIPDFTRYATSQRAQQVGQALGLPIPMTLFSFVGVAVTSATLIIYGTTIWDPVVLAGRFEGRWLVTGAMLAVALSTLSTNIAANIVSPANDFANLAPQRISFRMGGYFTGLVGLLIFPWKLIADPSGFIFTWLVGYSALLGPIGGILITDYYLLRHQELALSDLYQPEGQYRYRRGFNPVAIVALVLGILPCVSGFLAAIGVLDKAAVWSWLLEVYNYAWFVGFFVASGVYWVLMRGR
jgi:NCS1 family nucleobase:cation symporter-1